MATYRFFPSTSGPTAATAYSGPFIAGLGFYTTNACWAQGIWWWCCNTGQATTAVNAQLWQITGNTGTASSYAKQVPGTTIASSGTLTAGAWNYMAFSQAVPLSPGVVYVIGVGSPNSFPLTNGYFTTGGGAPNGITNGPLYAYSGQFGTLNGFPGWMAGQGLYMTSSSDATTVCPIGSNSEFNAWVDIQVTDTDPLIPGATYRLWPTNVAGMDANPNTFPDNTSNFVLSTEIDTTQYISFQKIWWYSYTGCNGAGTPPNAGTGGATTQLPTAVDIWSINPGGVTGTNFYHNASPSWSGAAGSGWVSVSLSSVFVAPGKWRVSVYNGHASPDHWSSYCYAFWAPNPSGGTALAFCPNGITNGPLYAPNNANSSLAYSLGNAGSTGTHVPGDLTETAQGVFNIGPANADPGDIFPNLVTGVNSAHPGPTFENFWIDFEVTPIPTVALSGSISSSSSLSGTIAAGITMPSGSITSVSSLAGALAGSAGVLAGPILSVSSLSGILSIGGIQFSGNITSLSQLNAYIAPQTNQYAALTVQSDHIGPYLTLTDLLRGGQ